MLQDNQELPGLLDVLLSERAKGAENASCGETVVQKGVLGESVSSLPLLRFALTTPENLKGSENFSEETDSPKTPFWTTVSPHDAFYAPLAHPRLSAKTWQTGLQY